MERSDGFLHGKNHRKEEIGQSISTQTGNHYQPKCSQPNEMDQPRSVYGKTVARLGIYHRLRSLFPTAYFAGVDYTGSIQHVSRADPEKLKEIFNKYASVTDKEGNKHMTSEDFVRKYLGMYPNPNYNRETIRLIAGAADTTKNGLVSFEEFQAFEACLCAPDALYLSAFEMFDTNASENVSFDEFERIIKHTKAVSEMDFDFDSAFIKLYFGNDKKRTLGYHDFCQLLHDFYEEQGIQAFKKYDKSNTGFITAGDFQRIMTGIKAHLLTGFVKDNIILATGGTPGHQVSFPHYVAFSSLLAKIELLKRIYTTVSKGQLGLELSKSEFLHAAQAYGQVTPAEIEILFSLSKLAHPERRTINFSDLERIDPEQLKRVSYMRRLTNLKVAEKPSDRGIGTQILESAYRFTMGSLAGAAGATAVYPIDLVKTRMQNQRTAGRGIVGEVMYRSSMDCFKKVLRHEGILGLYRGLLPQIVGVAPEKAIKLTTNDFVRDKLTFGGHIPLWAEVVAGGCGGASQVMFTNPIEIIKIRLQVAGEIQSGPKVNVFSIIKDLGIRNLYKGARACFLRDIPFSGIYFPVYAHMKLATGDANGHNDAKSLFGSAMTAGVPAAALVTPADVIKTRLQVAARAGQTTYSGVLDCFWKLLKEEGWKALWKGAGARVFRSSPQFGVTLVTYEVLQRIFYVDFGGTRPTGSEVSAHRTLLDHASENPDHVGGYKLARSTFLGIESKFGLFLPIFEPRPSLTDGSQVEAT